MAIAQPAASEVLDPADIAPNIDHIVTEDDTPVDNIFSEKQQRLLTESLYRSWPGPGAERVFMVAANVGVYAAVARNDRRDVFIPESPRATSPRPP